MTVTTVEKELVEPFESMQIASTVGKLCSHAGARLEAGRLIRGLSTASLYNDTVESALQQQSGPFPMRNYQMDCIRNVLKDFSNGVRSLAVSMPTGSGKTVTFCQMTQFLGPIEGASDKTLFVVHRRELVQQIASTLRAVHPDKAIGVEMAERRATNKDDFVVASVMSLQGDRLNRFGCTSFSNIVIDEAHHSATPSYVKILDHFRQKLNPRILGFSATMFRTDSVSLGSVYDKISFHIEMDELIRMGHLAKPHIVSVHALADLSKVSQHKGEFVVKSLASAVDTKRNNEAVVQVWKQMTENGTLHKSTLVFGVDIDHSNNLVQEFLDHGIDAKAVTSKTSKTTRAEYISQFRERKFPVLVNCSVFTEGTDMPEIDCVILDRPTKSLGLLMQMVGRGLRTHNNKPFCLIIDMFGASSKAAGQASVPTLAGVSPEFIKTVQYCPDADDKEPKFQEESKASQKPHQLGYESHDSWQAFLNRQNDEGLDIEFSQNHWLRCDKHSAILDGGDRGILRVTRDKGAQVTQYTKERYTEISNLHEEEPKGDYCIILNYKNPSYVHKNGQSKFRYFRTTLAAGIPTFRAAIQGGDTVASKMFPFALTSKNAAWMRDPAGAKQRAYAKSLIKASGVGELDTIEKWTRTQRHTSTIISLYKLGYLRVIRNLVLQKKKEILEEEPAVDAAPQSIRNLIDSNFQKEESPSKPIRA